MTHLSPLPWRVRISLALLLALAGIASGARAQAPAATAAPAARASRLAFSHALPELDGKKLQVKVVEVVYAPGQSSPPHSHPCAVIGYIVNGAVRMQMNDEPEVTYSQDRRVLLRGAERPSSRLGQCQPDAAGHAAGVVHLRQGHAALDPGAGDRATDTNPEVCRGDEGAPARDAPTRPSGLRHRHASVG